MWTYRCYFSFRGNPLAVDSDEGVASFKEGFWITGTGQFTKGADCQYWIPPHAIWYIEKIELSKPRKEAGVD